jgi:hypothetical protein
MKPVGKPDARNGPVRFDERGGETGRRSALAPAPLLDSTFGRYSNIICAAGAIIRPIICTCGRCQQLHFSCSPGVPVCIILDLEAVSEGLRRGQLQIADLLDAISKRYAVTVDQSASATSHRRELRNRVHTAGALLINRPNAGWRCHQRAAGHSWRSARIGSTLVARSAGIRLASTATTIRNSAAPAMLTGSAGLTR